MLLCRRLDLLLEILMTSGATESQTYLKVTLRVDSKRSEEVHKTGAASTRSLVRRTTVCNHRKVTIWVSVEIFGGMLDSSTCESLHPAQNS